MKHYISIIVVIALILFYVPYINAQIVISKPNLGFSQACASASFNTYNVTFTFSPDNILNPDKY